MKRSYYEVLGVSRDANAAQIHAAYIRLARRYHPDATGGDKRAEETFKAVVEANEVLSDPLSLLTVEEDAPLATMYHIRANQMQECARGASRHGSCGMGIWETYWLAKLYGDLVPRAKHLLTPKIDFLCRRSGVLGKSHPSFPPDLRKQEALTQALQRSSPVIEPAAGRGLEYISAFLNVPIGITSHGPRAEDKEVSSWL